MRDFGDFHSNHGHPPPQGYERHSEDDGVQEEHRPDWFPSDADGWVLLGTAAKAQVPIAKTVGPDISEQLVISFGR